MRWSILAATTRGTGGGAAQARPRERVSRFRGGVLLQDPLGLRRRVHRLFRRTHFPSYSARSRWGHISGSPLRRRASTPRKTGRWDYRVTIVWKTPAAPHEPSTEAELKRLFPDQDTFRREEQRRFESRGALGLPVVSVI